MVTFSIEDVDGLEPEMMEATFGDMEVSSDEEYREFVENHQLPDGYIWGRTPFGAKPGNWKIHVKEAPDIRSVGSELENELQSCLREWGCLNRFERDYHALGYQLDFVDSTHKIVLEPGAAYWHTPDGCSGSIRSPIGERPEEVYLPPTRKDIEKQNLLEEYGWYVLWISESGMENSRNKIRKWIQNHS